ISATIEMSVGSIQARTFDEKGRTVSFVVSSAVKKGDHILNSAVVDKKGNIIPLKNVVSMKTVSGPGVIHRIDKQLAIFITANVSEEASLNEARAVCERQFDETRNKMGLPASYRLMALQE